MAERIRVLDQDTVNKIAAGEVVERPASVVKELVENSLDADAASVSVMVEDGGKKSVLVRDDGVGMSERDAKAAFQRHATSKISAIDDLWRLRSFGFRGEALASIASVARVVLRTREHAAEEGTEVRVEGGRMVSVGPVGCAPGTEVVVEDLFFNVPARKKSMRSTRVELAHCRETVVSYMLSRPGLAFSFASDGDLELVHSPAEGMKGSLATAFGPRVAESMAFGEAEAEGIRAEAYVARLEHTRSAPSELRMFVNDRPVRSPRLVSAVVGAYGSKLMKDRYPVGVVRLFVEGSLVDVNVHPAKREVRFADERKVMELVELSVTRALDSEDLSFKYDLTRFSESFIPGPPKSADEHVQAIQSVLEPEEKVGETGDKPLVVPLAQIMSTYILAESSGNLLLIDQHAASERVVYERIIEAIESGREVSQTLLTPLVINLTAAEQRTLEENRQVIESAGFRAEPFGRGAFALRSIPTVLGVAQGESALRNILSELGAAGKERRPGLDVIWKVACHTAIRAGEPLSHRQMTQLISDLMSTKSPYTCEHGRPTMITLTSEDLERLFKRRG
ncbi:MAG: DNA mismatch repair endonuclease MutL [Thermoplasmata archaeon]